MNEKLVETFVAPGGRQPLRLVNVAEQRDGEIIEGAVFSPDWGLYSIHGGILNLLPRGPGARSLAQRSNFLWPVAWGYEWPWRTNALSLLGDRSLPPRREFTIFQEMLGRPAGGLWLDLGASTALYGRWLASLLAPHDGAVFSLDFSPHMLHVARRRAGAEGHRNIAFVIARAEQLPYPDGALDGVVCGGTLNEFGDRTAPVVLADLARVLKRGATALFLHLLAVGAGATGWAQRNLARPTGLAFWSRQESDELFEQAGFVVESRADYGVVAFTRLRRA